MKLGHHQQAMLAFVNSNNPDKKRCYSLPTDSLSLRVARSLERRNLLKLVDCGMCTAAGKTVFMAYAL